MHSLTSGEMGVICEDLGALTAEWHWLPVRHFKCTLGALTAEWHWLPVGL